jgi:hypothetical protein
MKFLLLAFITLTSNFVYSYELKNHLLSDLHSLIASVEGNSECGYLQKQEVQNSEVMRLLQHYYVGQLDYFTFEKAATTVEKQVVLFIENLQQMGLDYYYFDDGEGFDLFKFKLLQLAKKIDKTSDDIMLFNVTASGDHFSESAIVFYDDYLSEVVVWSIGTCE